MSSPKTSDLELEPFYFSSSGGELFGCYHRERASGVGADRVVVVCYPLGEQFVRAHRTLRGLATRLASSGLPVLRFDYFGCGDSQGDLEQANLDIWLENIVSATAEARRLSGRRRICLLGIQMGATLAALSGADVESLVLWDPVMTGSSYLERLASIQEGLEAEIVRSSAPERLDGAVELVGYCYSMPMRRDLERIDLSRLSRKPASRCLLVETGEAKVLEPLRSLLSNLGVAVDHCHSPDVPIPQAGPYLAAVPARTIHAVVSWLAVVSR